ncbi:MAG: Brp/Blh family beta-carotene 15,15'-dioxygenase [Gammaproteobacteria bacterium]|nr:Brp/Blh family beta-carotene 15,15'-dioxygenase [Gammaproteobacteria bacterium]
MAYRLQQWLFFLSTLVVISLFLSGVSLSMQWQLVILTVLVVLLGLPHGALDPIVAYRHGLWRDGVELARFLAVYLLIAALTLGLWLWASSLTFSLFLLLSVWHFANDWRHQLGLINRLGVALALIVLPSLFHPVDVQTIYSNLVNADDAAGLVTITAQLWPLVLVLLVSSVLQLVRRDIHASLEILFIVLAAMLLPPLVFFMVYFCLQHSPRHLLSIARREKPLTVLTTAAGLTGLTVILGWLSFQLLAGQDWSQTLLQIIFVGLIVLTVPHMILIEMIQRLQSRELSHE